MFKFASYQNPREARGSLRPVPARGSLRLVPVGAGET